MTTVRWTNLTNLCHIIDEFQFVSPQSTALETVLHSGEPPSWTPRASTTDCHTCQERRGGNLIMSQNQTLALNCFHWQKILIQLYTIQRMLKSSRSHINMLMLILFSRVKVLDKNTKATRKYLYSQCVHGEEHVYYPSKCNNTQCFLHPL